MSDKAILALVLLGQIENFEGPLHAARKEAKQILAKLQVAELIPSDLMDRLKTADDSLHNFRDKVRNDIDFLTAARAISLESKVVRAKNDLDIHKDNLRKAFKEYLDVLTDIQNLEAIKGVYSLELPKMRDAFDAYYDYLGEIINSIKIPLQND